jgi:hypothetical protein
MAVRIEYVGFVDTDLTREYSLVVQEPAAEAKTFVLAIAKAAFNSKNARYQDGPDICYQKLLAILAASPAEGGRIVLTEEDLYHYRHAHAPKPPRHRVTNSPLASGEAGPAASGLPDVG